VSDPSTRPAFVAGATGYTGREVVRELCRRGVDTIAHVRPDSARLDEWRGRFAAVGARFDTTPWRDDAIEDLLRRERPALVFALLGTTRARRRRAHREGRPDESYHAVDYGLTALLMRATAAAATDARFVYLSAAGVRPGSRNPYIAARARAEAELRASGLDWIIARPAFVTGPDREENRPLERFASTTLDAILTLAALLGAKSLQRRYASLPGPTLARTLVNLALDPTATQTIARADALRSPSP